MLANFEYFSSTFKNFNVYVAEQYPPKAGKENDGWLLLGSFVAANVRDSQYFKVKDPLLFTRYLKLEFISYYGSEYYCPMTQLKVFGKTEMEEFREEEELLANSAKEEEEIMKEAIRNVAIRAVKEIDSVACMGEGCGSTTLPSIIYPKPGTISFEEVPPLQVAEPVPQQPTPQYQPTYSQASPDAVPSEASSYILTADYFRLFMESQDQTSPAIQEDSPGIASTTQTTTSDTSQQTGQPTVGQESIFKTISKRLNLLERNSTLSYKFIEEQSRAYHAAFIRVEAARAEAIKKALGECNKTMTRVVRELANDYEAAWSFFCGIWNAKEGCQILD
ncbi:hypothetical protein BCR33DRAFT_189681 [Rhizoclosmatium globosum]|uniref:SUN domain-containing protein n=1 Tax=Rhizoclosmatium globosum TaxID=329046 RepID=A0A1Y2D231_9FUNG|nr:hypothetical protein BCR33DRAFT_189681 [Rhizoclosmatium globosum]|eukprot:ORY53176.1 hypothetical protein BCR33DRAFT_189681 [Rhizoclosmatium globosum]